MCQRSRPRVRARASALSATMYSVGESLLDTRTWCAGRRRKVHGQFVSASMGTLLIYCARNLSVRNFPRVCLGSFRFAEYSLRARLALPTEMTLGDSTSGEPGAFRQMLWCGSVLSPSHGVIISPRIISFFGSAQTYPDWRDQQMTSRTAALAFLALAATAGGLSAQDRAERSPRGHHSRPLVCRAGVRAI